MNFALVIGMVISMEYVLSQDASYVYKAETECMDTFPSITRDYMESIKQAKKLPDNPTQDFKCFLHCVGMKIEAIAGLDLLLDMLKSITSDITGGDLADDTAHEVVVKCMMAAKTPDECELSWEFVECMADELQDYKLHHTFCPTCKHD